MHFAVEQNTRGIDKTMRWLKETLILSVGGIIVLALFAAAAFISDEHGMLMVICFLGAVGLLVALIKYWQNKIAPFLPSYPNKR